MRNGGSALGKKPAAFTRIAGFARKDFSDTYFFIVSRLFVMAPSCCVICLSN